MKRRDFLRAAVLAGGSTVKLSVTDKTVAAPRELALLTEAGRIAAEVAQKFHRPWLWKPLPKLIEQSYLAAARAWLGYRGIALPDYEGYVFDGVRRSPDDVSGIPWRAAYRTLLELRQKQIETTDYFDGWYREGAWRVRLHGVQRQALHEAMQACDRCRAAVRSELATGCAEYRPPMDAQAIKNAERAKLDAELKAVCAQLESKQLREKLQAYETAEAPRLQDTVARGLSG